jgi:hypothetical protein
LLLFLGFRVLRAKPKTAGFTVNRHRGWFLRL